MRPRDWIALGSRLLSIYLLILVARDLTDAIGAVAQAAPASVYVPQLVATGVLLAGALFVRAGSLRVSRRGIEEDAWAIASGRPIAGPSVRQGIAAALVVGGLFLAAANSYGLVVSAWTAISPPKDPRFPADAIVQQRQAQHQVAGSGLEVLAGLALAAGAARIAARVELPDGNEPVVEVSTE